MPEEPMRQKKADAAHERDRVPPAEQASADRTTDKAKPHDEEEASLRDKVLTFVAAVEGDAHERAREMASVLGQAIGDKGLCTVVVPDAAQSVVYGPHHDWSAGSGAQPIRMCNFSHGENPSGGYVHGPGVCVVWQHGPRGADGTGKLNPPNGAFVEDLLVIARERLAFFQASKFADAENQAAMDHIGQALSALGRRAKQRHLRGVLGTHTP